MSKFKELAMFLLSGISCFSFFWSIILGLSFQYIGGAICAVIGVFFLVVYLLVKNSPSKEP